MKLRFKHQKFQADAAKAVVDVFQGQPKIDGVSYLADKGVNQSLNGELDTDFIGFKNAKVVLDDETVLNNLQKVQRENLIKPSKDLEGRYNLTIEMETGVGKTYTYIKTMYELNQNTVGASSSLSFPASPFAKACINLFKSPKTISPKNTAKKSATSCTIRRI